MYVFTCAMYACARIRVCVRVRSATPSHISGRGGPRLSRARARARARALSLHKNRVRQHRILPSRLCTTIHVICMFNEHFTDSRDRIISLVQQMSPNIHTAYKNRIHQKHTYPHSLSPTHSLSLLVRALPHSLAHWLTRSQAFARAAPARSFSRTNPPCPSKILSLERT